MSDMGMTLVEREAVLASLGQQWQAVRRTGRGAVVLLRGEAGSGKTALLRAFADSMSDRVSWGACHPLSTPRPLGPLAEIAEQLGGELADLVAGEGRPHEIAATLARSASKDGPAVVVLEDLHWADDATLDVLRMLVRPLQDRALLLLASYRDDEVARYSGLQSALGDLAGPDVVRLDLLPLSAAAVKTLSRGTRRDPVELHRVTGGNPFHVIELLAAPDDTVPSTVRDAALGRLSRLSTGAREVAEAVSVVPQRVELGLLEAVVGLEHLDEAVAGGLLLAHEDGIDYRHELARSAVEGSLLPYRRVSLHRAVLSALAGGDPARLAHHAEGAQDSEAVVRHARTAAARAARLGSKREAAAHYEQALGHTPTDDLGLRAELLEGFSYAAYLVDRMDEAVTSLEEALAIRRELGDRQGEGRVLLDLSRRLSCAGRLTQVTPCIETALTVLEELPPSRDLALAYGLTGFDAAARGDVDGTHSWGQRAVELAEQVGAVDVVVYALNTMGTFELMHGRDPELLLRSLQLAREHDLDEAVGRAHMHLAGTYADARDPERLAYVEEAIADCDRRGLVLWRRYLEINLAQMHLALGRWDETADSMAAILASASTDPLLRILALCLTAKVRLRRGDPGGAEALAEAQQLVQGHDHVGWQVPVQLVAAELVWLQGGAAPAETERGLELARFHDDHWGGDELVRWRRLCGVPGEAASGRTLFSEPAPSQWRDLGSGFETALALLEEGDEVEALALLQMIGAAGTAARVAKGLRDRGRRDLPRGPRVSTRSNPMQLTDRELEVLALLVEGLANSAIAERLVLSTKTIDKHVSAVLRKLGVSSRRDAAARAHELALTPASV